MFKMKLKKIIACLCIVFMLCSIFVIPDVTCYSVEAEPVSISMGLFEQVFNTIAGSLGMRSTKESKYYGFPSVEELFNSFKESYKWVQQTQAIPLALTVDAWVCSSLKDFTEGAIKVFPFFMQDIRDGKFDGVIKTDTSDIKNSFNNFVATKKVANSFMVNSQIFNFKYSNLAESSVTDVVKFGKDNVTFEQMLNEIDSDSLDEKANYFIAYQQGMGTRLYAFSGEAYIYIDASTKLMKAYSWNSKYGYYQYDSPGYGRKHLVGDITDGIMNNDYNFSWIRGDNFKYFTASNSTVYGNMNIDVFEDGSIMFYTPALLMDKATFDTITDSLWNQIALPGANIDDWQLADENGKTIDEPDSKILEKIYNNMLTSDDIDAIREGNTDALSKLDGMTAVNEKTGETVGDIKEDTVEAVGLLQGAKLILSRIFKRQLTLINVVKNLVKGKWTSVIDNVGDLTLPLVNAIDSVKQVVIGLSLTHWVIDNVADIYKPISTAIDTMNGNIANVLSGFGNAILNAIDDIQAADLSDVIAGIKAVPKSIADAFAQPFEAVKTAIAAVSTTVGDLFAPPPVALTDIYNKGNNIFDTHFGMPKAAFKTFMVEGKEVPDVKYKVGNKEYTVIPFSYFNKFVDKFRIYIQTSFVFIWIVWFANQVLALFDKSAIISGHISDIGRGER